MLGESFEYNPAALEVTGVARAALGALVDFYAPWIARAKKMGVEKRHSRASSLTRSGALEPEDFDSLETRYAPGDLKVIRAREAELRGDGASPLDAIFRSVVQFESNRGATIVTNRDGVFVAPRDSQEVRQEDGWAYQLILQEYWAELAKWSVAFGFASGDHADEVVRLLLNGTPEELGRFNLMRRAAETDRATNPR